MAVAQAPMAMGGLDIVGIIGFILSLIIVFAVVNPILRNRGFVLLFRLIIGLIALLIINFIIQLVITLVFAFVFRIF